jgi:hypothetical protein
MTAIKSFSFYSRGNQDPQVPEERMVLRGQRGLRGWWARRVPQEQLGKR